MAVDLTGKKFGRWTVVRLAVRTPKLTTWNVVCECGTERIVRGGHLCNGASSSCGCLRVERAVQANTKHGGSRRVAPPEPEYITWKAMLGRCTNKNSSDYKNYGGRGIIVCDRWRHDYAAFRADMGQRPDPSSEIDRIDNDGNYEPSNCRWATKREQSRNQRRTRKIDHAGQSLVAADWSETTGISDRTIKSRLRYGWTEEQAVTKPVVPKAKLTADKVREIRARYASGGVTMMALGDEYGVHNSSICTAINGKTWRNVT